jgi:hypothetical protein
LLEEKRRKFMVYEVRFQTVDPQRRDDYVKMYKEAIQGCKAAGCRSGMILFSEDDPAAVMVLLEWPTKEHISTGAALLPIRASAPPSKAGRPSQARVVTM